MPIHDLRCKSCDQLELDVVVHDRPYPPCERCGGERDWVPARLTTDEWGQSRYFKSLDMEFRHKSDLRAYMKKNHIREAGDRVGGSRNEDGFKGTVFSRHSRA